MAYTDQITDTTHSNVASSELLIGLPEGTPQAKYSNMERLKRAADAQALRCAEDDLQSPFVIVTCVPYTILEEFDNFYPRKGPRIKANLRERVLVLEVMVQRPHETATAQLTRYIQSGIDSTGLGNELIAGGGPREVNINMTWVKEPDSSFWLNDDIGWPVLAIETGLSEDERKLAVDAQGWLEAEGSQTQAVITVKIDRYTPHITFRRWEHYYPPSRPVTRRYQPIGSCMETVDVIHCHGATRATGNLTIPVAKLLRREACWHDGTDFVVERASLIKIAELTWRSQGFM